MAGGQDINQVELMSKEDMKWQGGIIIGAIAFIVAALLAVDLGEGRRRQQTDRLFDGLISGENVESDFWLLVARVLAVVVVAALGYYMLRVKPNSKA